MTDAQKIADFMDWLLNVKGCEVRHSLPDKRLLTVSELIKEYEQAGKHVETTCEGDE